MEGEATDVLLAFDTTGSMAPSIQAAQRDAQAVVSAVGGFAPNTRFAVASFRDRFYPGGQYTLVSPMTPDTASIIAAINTLKAVDTLDRSRDTSAEAYNLLFRKTYTDRRIGWRPNARKIVVVIGDAEPHGAGSEGLAGCTDRTRDWNGLSATRELAAMRAARRTLVMIRQVRTATTSLACYSTLASLGYEGGAARDGGSQDIAAPVVSLVKQAFAPFAITPQLARAVAGRTNGLTIRIANPNRFPLRISELSLRLPARVAYVPRSATGSLPQPTIRGRLVTWRVSRPIEPLRTRVGHIVIRAFNVRSTTLTARVVVSPPDGRLVDVQAETSIRFVRRPNRTTIVAAGDRRSVSIRGEVTTPLARVAARSAGAILLRVGRSRSVMIRPIRASARALGAPSAVSVRVMVARSTRLAGCRARTTGRLDIVDSDGLTRRGKTRDRLTLVLPPSCGGTQRFSDAASGGALAVKLGFH